MAVDCALTESSELCHDTEPNQSPHRESVSCHSLDESVQWSNVQLSTKPLPQSLGTLLLFGDCMIVV